jgi:ribosomal protein L32
MSESTSRRSQRRREPRGPATAMCCSECGTFHQSRWCPECGQPPGLMVVVLHTEITTHAGGRWEVRAERDDESGGWVPTGMTRLSDEDAGTPWGA